MQQIFEKVNTWKDQRLSTEYKSFLWNYISHAQQKDKVN